MSKKQADWDDGRTVAPMDLDGMPGFRRTRRRQEISELQRQEEPLYDPRARRAMYRGIFKASALLIGVYIAAFTLFILFCVFVWFR